MAWMKFRVPIQMARTRQIGGGNLPPAYAACHAAEETFDNVKGIPQPGSLDTNFLKHLLLEQSLQCQGVAIRKEAPIQALHRRQPEPQSKLRANLDVFPCRGVSGSSRLEQFHARYHGDPALVVD